jgi:hypothetical protein
MRTGLKAITAAAALAAMSMAGGASAATMLTAGWTEGCSKSTCFNESGVFSKKWSSADATGPISVGQLLLDRGVLGALDSKTFRLSFRLNGQELGTWGSFTMGGIDGDQLMFGGEAFTWNPEDGDLELVLELIPPPKAGAGGRMASFIGAPLEETFPTETPGKDQEGEPDGEPGGQPGGVRPTPVTAVPEPSAWALMITGFGAAGALLRRKRVVLQAQPSR